MGCPDETAIEAEIMMLPALSESMRLMLLLLLCRRL